VAERYFLAGIHFITKALADVDYPISKAQLIAKVGSREVQMDWDKKQTMKQLIEPLKVDKFETAAHLFYALVAGL